MSTLTDTTPILTTNSNIVMTLNFTQYYEGFGIENISSNFQLELREDGTLTVPKMSNIVGFYSFNDIPLYTGYSKINIIDVNSIVISMNNPTPNSNGAPKNSSTLYRGWKKGEEYTGTCVGANAETNSNFSIFTWKATVVNS